MINNDFQLLSSTYFYLNIVGLCNDEKHGTLITKSNTEGKVCVNAYMTYLFIAYGKRFVDLHTSGHLTIAIILPEEYSRICSLIECYELLRFMGEYVLKDNCEWLLSSRDL